MVKKAAQATPNRLLRAARKEQGWTQQQVADRIGAPFPLNISRWENGTASPSAYYLERLCQLFGKNVSELGMSQLADELPEKLAPRPVAPHEQQGSRAVQQSSQRETGPPPVDPGMETLPSARNPFFLGREDVLARLRHLWQPGQTSALNQLQAISGLGGVGKTQVALEYAYRYAMDNQSVWWVRADSREALVSGLLSIAHALSLPQRDERDQGAIVAAVKGWLRQHTGWLLILDNADDPTLLPEFLPAPLRGHVLLTTRAQALGRLAARIEIEPLDLDTGPLLLLRRAGLLALDAPLAQAEPSEWQEAVRLSHELGGLPLALDQAGAYLEETGCGLPQYLELYRSHRTGLLRHRGGVVSDHPDPVATTWTLSFGLVESRSALAADLLRLCAVLYPDAMPEELFLQGAAHLGPTLAVLQTGPLAFNQALAVIGSYSLLRRNSREHTLSMHRLVQAVLFDAMSTEEREQWCKRAIAALNAVFPGVWDQGWEQWEQCGRLLPHVLTLAAVTVPQTQGLELASLLTRAADYLLHRAQYTQAESFYQRALSMCEQTLGRDHAQVSLPLCGLANLYREQGRFEQAEPLLQRALHLRQPLGPEHPEIPCPLKTLAVLHFEQGKYAQVEPLLQRDLHLKEQALGPEHPKLTFLLNNLAVLYCEQGQYERAELLLLRALRISEQAYGPEHPDVALPLNNLADCYQELGRFEWAEPLYQRALHILDQRLGRDHPRSAFPLHGLADLYRGQGRYEQAEPLYQRALAIRQQQLGTHLPATGDDLHDVACFYELRNQPEQALASYQQALAIREQRLGPQHPRTRDTRTRYASLLRASGRAEEAAALEAASS